MNDGGNTGLNKLFVEHLDEISSDDGAEQFLRENGVDPDKLIADTQRKLRQIQMNIAAENTERQYQEMRAAVSVKAAAEVATLLSDASFNLANFIKANSVNVAYRNFDNMSKEEVKEFLERHFLLKFEKEASDKIPE